MILANKLESREKALGKLLPYQKNDFIELFRTMKGFPVTVRLLDPPLHEFLPKEKKDIEELSKKMKVPVKTLMEKIADLHEFNPMLGHRGCRLAITFPEIYDMQTTAIIEAAIEVTSDVTSMAASMIAVVCISYISGKVIAKRQPLCPNIGLNSCKSAIFSIKVLTGTFIFLESSSISFFSFGKNSCKGGSRSRTVTGKPFIVRKSSIKSFF